jgi:NADH-quinone oxidoreductase subunit M
LAFIYAYFIRFSFLIFTLSNIGLPGTSSFVGEFLIILGTVQFNFIVIFLGAISVILGAVYALWLYNRVMFGLLKSDYLEYFCDINKREFFILLPLCFFSIYGGLYPKIFFDTFELSLLFNLKFLEI